MPAERVGVSKGYLPQIENGRMSGTLEPFARLAAALEITLDDLTGWARGILSVVREEQASS